MVQLANIHARNCFLSYDESWFRHLLARVARRSTRFVLLRVAVNCELSSGSQVAYPKTHNLNSVSFDEGGQFMMSCSRGQFMVNPGNIENTILPIFQPTMAHGALCIVRHALLTRSLLTFTRPLTGGSGSTVLLPFLRYGGELGGAYVG